MTPNEYNEDWATKWSFAQLPMLPEKWRFKVKQGCEAQFKILKELMNRDDVDEIICATDADREGECIFRYVYKLIGCKKPVKRLWVSSLEESAIKSALSSILKLVSARLIMAVAEPHKYETIKVIVTCENTHFTAIGKTVIKAGWKALETKINAALKNKDSDENEKKEASLPEMQQGVIFKNVSACKSEHWTSPPKSYTEKTLLKAMETAGNKDYVEDSDVEKKGLGTPATRAGIIEQLVRNDYVERKKKQLIATEKGIKIISVVPEKMKSTKLTADWETDLQHIEKGIASADSFMESIVNYTKEICAEYGKHDNNVVFVQSSEREVIGKCPRCSKDVISTQKAYSCNGGKDGCGFIVWKSIAGKNISAAQAKKLIGKRKTDLIKGFKSKSGKEFNAYLILKDDYSTGFVFK